MSAAARRVVVDQVTRIEGHLRIEVATDAERRITQAYSSGTHRLADLNILTRDNRVILQTRWTTRSRAERVIITFVCTRRTRRGKTLNEPLVRRQSSSTGGTN